MLAVIGALEEEVDLIEAAMTVSGRQTQAGIETLRAEFGGVETLGWVQREFSALATEMEGAAVGVTCELNEVPFVVIRARSDTASETASDDFAANLDRVCETSFRPLEALIPAIGAAPAGANPDYQKVS